jgi:hypothetical protein
MTPRGLRSSKVLARVFQRNVDVVEARVDFIRYHDGECRCDALADFRTRQPEDDPVLRCHLQHQEILSLLRGRHHDVAKIKDVLRLRRAWYDGMRLTWSYEIYGATGGNGEHWSCHDVGKEPAAGQRPVIGPAF